MFKLSISNIAWSAEHDTEMYAFIHDAGYEAIEIAPTRIFVDAPYDHLLQAKQWAQDIQQQHGLRVSSMQSIWYGRQEKVFGTANERKALVDYTKKAILFAETISCRNLVFGNPRNRNTEDVAANMPTAIEFFHEIGEYASEHNTVIALEPNPEIYNTHFMNMTEQAAEMAYKANSEGIKVNVDLGTVIHNNEDIEYLRQIPEYINHVHISEPWLDIIKERELHQSLFALLNDIDYRHYVSIEMGNKGNIDTVRNTMKYLKSVYDRDYNR